MGAAPSTGGPTGGLNGSPLDLAGAWVPTRESEWYNNNPGKHKNRALASNTRLVYEQSGIGKGNVGEFAIINEVTQIAPGQYTCVSRVPHGWGMGWIAYDGNFTLLGDGTLHVSFPSNGITEYWRREGGYDRRISNTSAPVASAPVAHASNPQVPWRPVRIAIRRFAKNSELGSLENLCWHWGVCVGDEHHCYETQGSMVIFGPRGMVAASSPLMIRLNPTHINQYEGLCDLGQSTQKTDQEIEEFSRAWVKRHPIYLIAGPNCQTYAEDLFTFLTGENLPFPKSSTRMTNWSRGEKGTSGGDGPESHPGMSWIAKSVT